VRILHFCSRDEWASAAVNAGGEYTADSFGTEGFIHCSTFDLAAGAANRHALGRTDLVLLEIDQEVLAEPPRYEPGNPADPDSPLYPHLYRPLPVAAVVRVVDFPPNPDGTFTVPEELRSEGGP
jgi:uncharacterized protein (DUF952 family)